MKVSLPNKDNAKYLISDEESEKLGINPSGKISGAAAILYEGKSIESSMSMDHFSCEISVSEIPKEGEKWLEHEVKRIRFLYKDTAWSKVQQIVHSKLFLGNEKFSISDIVLFPIDKLRRYTIPMC